MQCVGIINSKQCAKEKIFARGLCNACYWRQRRRGTLERANVQNTGVCSVPGCGKATLAKNLCPTHYHRERNAEASGLFHTWRLLRSRAPAGYPPSWERFEAFHADVGDRPGPKHQLRRKDIHQPWSTANFHWVEPVKVKKDYYTPEQRKAYERAWRFQRKFNITIEEYGRLYAAQGGVCACCGQPETHVHRSGKSRDMAIDHDHTTGEVRGLLCGDCNRAIGLFKDDPALLRRAAAYLE